MAQPNRTQSVSDGLPSPAPSRCHDSRGSAPESRVPPPAPAPLPTADPRLPEQPASTPLNDPRWTTPVGVPHEAFAKVADIAGSGTPIQHLVNVAIYGRASSGGVRRVSPRQALSAFEAALTLVLANGQLAAEAMFQAGFPRAEIDDRITRFTRALHFVSTYSSMPSGGSEQGSLVAVASERGSDVFSAASGTNPGAAFSATCQPGAVTTPAPAISSSAADVDAPASAVSSANAPTASSGGEA